MSDNLTDQRLQPLIDKMHTIGWLPRHEFNELYRHSLWFAKKEEVIAERGYRCEVCKRGRGDIGISLQCHHMQYPEYYCPWEIPNSMAKCLCKKHHEAEGSRRRMELSEDPRCLRCDGRLINHWGVYVDGSPKRDSEGYALDDKNIRIVEKYRFCTKCINLQS